jgi:hypothetical protein
MSSRAPILAVLLAAGALLAACATTAPETADAPTERVYRTGSNIPVKEGSGSRVTNAKPDDMPRAPSMPMPRGGGG